MAAVAYGHVAIVPKGIWNADTQYEVCQLVEYDGSSYVAKAQPPVGTLPTDTSYWQVSAAGTKKASSGSLGTVMPDGSTTEVNEEGKLSAKTAQQNALGVVKGSDDITVGEDGNLTVNTTFEQATEIANIIAGEAIKSVLGKVSKAIATTMSLDENALLKNMISGIDVNDGNKVPSSAYIHSLVERIGMGTALEGGFDNLTAGLNSVNNNLSNLSNFKKVIADDTSATDIEDLLKKKCKLIKDSGLGVGFYAVIGGWSGHNYGLTIGENMSGIIRIAYFDLNDIYQASCNASDLNNFSYKKVPNSTELDKKAAITDLTLYAKKTDLSTSQDNSYIVTKQNTIDKTLFSNAQFKARRPVNGTGAAAYSFENVGINSGALYLDPSDYKLHFINYDGKKFIINWTAES